MIRASFPIKKGFVMMSSFKGNIKTFYKWFEKNESTLRDLMDKNKMTEAYQFLEPEIKKVLGDLCFQIHKDNKINRYYLELTTLLDDSKKVIGFAFCDELPLKQKEYWGFYYYHPAFKGTVDYKGKTYQASDFKVIPTVNSKNKKIDINVVNKSDFKGMSDQDKFMITYMMLADYIGELVVDAYIGGISFGRTSLFKKNKGKVVPLEDLYDSINTSVLQNKWIKPKDIKLIASNFKQVKNKSLEIRKDIQDGISYCVELLNEEGSNNTDLTDYIKSLKIGVYSISIRHNSSNEKNKALKNEVEKRLTGILAKDKSGFMVHSIHGNAYDYADFFLYDASLVQLIKQEITDKLDDTKLIEL